jgi:UDP-glucose 4-epimerase
MIDYRTEFVGRNILITGGLGFIGSHLAIKLIELGAHVTLVDAMISDYGGNLFNIEPVKDKVIINFCDIRDANAMNYLVKSQDYIFHLAGQVCHVMSLTNPFPDIDINIKGTAIVMEACKRHNPEARVIYTGTRGQYGSSVKLPVNEDAPTNPLTNTYGPRAQMKHSRYGIVNWFVRLAIDDETIKVFGDGQIVRDFLFVDDCVEALLMSAVCQPAVGEIFNVGIDKPTKIVELAETIVRVAKSGRWEFAPFTPERKAQEPGDFYSDISKIRRVMGWEPKTSLEEGLRRTIEYYRRYKDNYW